MYRGRRTGEGSLRGGGSRGERKETTNRAAYNREKDSLVIRPCKQYSGVQMILHKREELEEERLCLAEGQVDRKRPRRVVEAVGVE